MHYTSIENIHKVIDPLFLDALINEFNEIKGIQVIRTRKKRLEKFQDKLSSLHFLDPAAGFGVIIMTTSDSNDGYMVSSPLLKKLNMD